MLIQGGYMDRKDSSRQRCRIDSSTQTDSGMETGPRAGRPGFDSQQRQEMFLFATAMSRPAVAFTLPPIQ